MNKRTLLSRILCFTGLVMMTIGAVTILWSAGINRFLGFLLGSGIVRFWCFPLGGGMVALGAFLGKSRYRKSLYGALALTVCGLIAFILMAIASFEAPTFGWYMFVVCACPIIGAVMSLVCAVLIVVEMFLPGGGFVNKRMLWSRILCIAGIVVSVVGVVSFRRYGILRYNLTELCLFLGSGLIALSAFLGRSRYRTFAYGALGLAVIEVGAWVVYLGWSTGPGQPYSLRIDGLLHLSYVLSLFASLAGVMLVLLEFFRAWMESVPMDTRRLLSRIFTVIGLAVMAIGVVAIVGPLQAWGGIVCGFSYFVLGIGLAALGAYLGTRPYRRFLYGILLVIAALCFLMFIGMILDGMSGGSF